MEIKSSLQLRCNNIFSFKSCGIQFKRLHKQLASWKVEIVGLLNKAFA